MYVNFFKKLLGFCHLAQIELASPLFLLFLLTYLGLLHSEFWFSNNTFWRLPCFFFDVSTFTKTCFANHQCISCVPRMLPFLVFIGKRGGRFDWGLLFYFIAWNRVSTMSPLALGLTLVKTKYTKYWILLYFNHTHQYSCVYF